MGSSPAEITKTMNMGKKKKSVIKSITDGNPDFTTHLRMAMNIAGMNITQFGVDLTIAILDAVMLKGGNLTVHDITDIEVALQKQYANNKQESIV